MPHQMRRKTVVHIEAITRVWQLPGCGRKDGERFSSLFQLLKAAIWIGNLIFKKTDHCFSRILIPFSKS